METTSLFQILRNLQLLNLERQNLITAKDNHDIAMDRYIQGDLSGFEVREAQKSLLDAEERILSAEYNTKLCEISLYIAIHGNIVIVFGSYQILAFQIQQLKIVAIGLP